MGQIYKNIIYVFAVAFEPQAVRLHRKKSSLSKRNLIGAFSLYGRGIMYKSLPVFFLLLLTGCAGSLGKINATDPTERGLSYVAAAIVTGAVIRAVFNK